MVEDAFVWRCSKVGCPDPDFPKDYKAEHCTSSRGPALCKSMRHGWKYHYKQVTVPWKGGRTTLVRDKVTGLFYCPCGAPSHARQDGQRMFRLCRRRVHPSTDDDIAKSTASEQNGSTEEDDDDDEDKSQPCIMISSSPSPATPTSSTSKASPSAGAHLTAKTRSSRAGSATRTRPKTALSTYAPASRQSRRKRARSVSSSSEDSEIPEGEEDSQILVLKQEFQKVRQKRAAMWRRLIDKEKEELKKDMKRAKLD